MVASRLDKDSRRRQILDAAAPCFAQYGFAQTTTKRLAEAAGISEGLLFKHFPTKRALYEAILADVCEADPELKSLAARPPSTRTLVLFVCGMVARILRSGPCQEDQKLRLTVASHLDDGEFARILFEKVERIVMPIFCASLERAVAAGEAKPTVASARDLFWLAHHAAFMLRISQMPAVPSLVYDPGIDLERQVCEFILRGIGLLDGAIAVHLDAVSPFDEATSETIEPLKNAVAV
jgi:AcrR family transcriptional regulator